jgi:hypothetical protein
VLAGVLDEVLDDVVDEDPEDVLLELLEEPESPDVEVLPEDVLLEDVLLDDFESRESVR